MVQHGSAIVIIGERVGLVYENNFFSHLLIFFASTYILCTVPRNHWELALRERKDGSFCTFNDFNIFAQLTFPSLPQIPVFGLIVKQMRPLKIKCRKSILVFSEKWEVWEVWECFELCICKPWRTFVNSNHRKLSYQHNKKIVK